MAKNEKLSEELNHVFHELIKTMKRNDIFIFNDENLDIHPLDFCIINSVHNNPDIILKEIIEETRIPSSTLTSAINRLEKNSLVKRIISDRDKRSFGLELTEDGKKIVDAHKIQQTNIFNIILDALDSKEQEQFIDIFRKITKHINVVGKL